MKTLPLAAALALGIASAYAADKPKPEPRHWTVLDFGSGQCVEHPRFATPDILHKGLRHEGLVDEVAVEKDNDGNVFAVYITATIKGTEATMAYFTSPALCEIGRKIAADQGLISDPNDMN